MDQQLVLAALGGLVIGALVTWAVASSVLGARSRRERLRQVEARSIADATARAERERREQLEADLAATQDNARELERKLAVATERVDSARQLLASQQSFVEDSRKQLEDSFRSLAATALKGSSEQFLTLAEQRMETSHVKAAADLDERRLAIETLLGPLHETLGRLDKRTQEIENSRIDAYSRLDNQVQLLAQATASLQDKTTSLATALSGSQVKGRWGEIALRNIAELAGMTAHCDFEEQATLLDGGRPDMTVRLPGKRLIAVDAKAPLAAYLEAAEADDDAGRTAALDRHVRALRGHIRALAARDYAEALGADVDLVVMFLPGDPFLSAAFARDPELQVEALRSKVLIATPTTLVALLRTVAIYWQQRSLAENAEAIAAAARELYERAAKFGEELSGVGRGLQSALDAYNRAVGSFSRRLMPVGRRLEEMKVSEQTKRALTEPEPIESLPRRVTE